MQSARGAAESQFRAAAAYGIAGRPCKVPARPRAPLRLPLLLISRGAVLASRRKMRLVLWDYKNYSVRCLPCVCLMSSFGGSWSIWYNHAEVLVGFGRDLDSGNGGQEVDADVILECRRLLIDKARELYPQNAEVIISYIAANEPIEDIRRYSFDEVKSLIIDVALIQEIALLPPALIPTCEIGTLHHAQLQSHPPSHPIGLTGAFQNPCSKLIGFEDHFQSLSIPGDAMRSNYQSDSTNVDGYPSNYKVQTDHSFDHLGSLHMLDMEIKLHILERAIRDLLLSQPSSSFPVDHHEKKYLERYGKPLDIEGFQTEGQMNRKVDCSLIDLLMQRNTTRVIERQGQNFVVPVKDDSKYLTHGSESVMPPARTDSNQIYITFKAKTKSITETDVQSYFSKYGTVSEVRFPSKQRRMFGFVSFLDPGLGQQNVSYQKGALISYVELKFVSNRTRKEMN
ncbi:hypothetical protein U9M48_015715 [Paspalum notatum var. saurae]|uniref:RRM domain-containing protein n=1 Tax=Paspalum notatum var. saurae TaxID=547442 RepID=A0AAQ3WM10_PASNO